MIDPRGMADAREWSDFITPELERLAVMPTRLDNPLHWREWALDLVQFPALQAYQFPDPRVYSLWQEWAERFNQIVNY